MQKKLILFLVSIIFLSGFHFAFAGLSINEIFYSPTTKQWVEIYNDSDSSIDITKYKILDSGALVNGHGIAAIAGGSNFIEPHDYAVVAKVPDDFSAATFRLFKSSLGIKSTEDTFVTLKDTAGVAPDNTVTILKDSALNGNSLQLIGGQWVSAIPTPGAINQNSAVPPAAGAPSGSGGLVTDNSASVASPASTTETKSKTVVETKISTKISGKTLNFVGVPLSLSAAAFGHQGEPLHFGKYFWNFGDGDSKEVQLSAGGPFTHTYFYPGDYLISLDYYESSYSDIPDASDQITVKIIPSDILISAVGDEKDFFVEISNNTGYAADISNWLLTSQQKSFMIPRNTILQAKNKIIISPKITNFSIEDKSTLRLLTPQGSVVFDYSASVAPAPVAQDATIIAPKTENSVSIEPEPTVTAPVQTVSAKNNVQIPAVDLAASAINSTVTGEDAKTSNELPVVPIASLIFIGAGAGSVYFIRKKRVVPQAVNDFEILEE